MQMEEYAKVNQEYKPACWSAERQIQMKKYVQVTQDIPGIQANLLKTRETPPPPKKEKKRKRKKKDKDMHSG